MEDEGAAFGMFTFKTAAGEKELDLGDGGKLSGYYLNFRKGRFLATLVGFDESDETVRGLLDIARAVDARIDDRGKEPGIVSLLPVSNLNRDVLKYFRGILGLNNAHPHLSPHIAGFIEGVRGSYEPGYSLMIFKYGSGEEALNGFGKAAKSFGRAADTADLDRSAGEFFPARDARGNPLYLEAVDEFILVAAGMESQETAQAILSEAKEIIRKRASPS